jgi:hypothetical protein
MGLQVARCNNDTMMDYAKSDPDLSLTASWAKNANSDILLNNPYVNVTMFMPTNDAVRASIFSYSELKKFQSFTARRPAYNLKKKIPLFSHHKFPFFHSWRNQRNRSKRRSR